MPFRKGMPINCLSEKGISSWCLFSQNRASRSYILCGCFLCHSHSQCIQHVLSNQACAYHYQWEAAITRVQDRHWHTILQLMPTCNLQREVQTVSTAATSAPAVAAAEAAALTASCIYPWVRLAIYMCYFPWSIAWRENAIL